MRPVTVRHRRWHRRSGMANYNRRYRRIRVIYRGYELEQKTLMVGWQITITKDGIFVRNGSVTSKLATAMDDAHEFIDGLLAPALSKEITQ